jgi:hypothetical protein
MSSVGMRRTVVACLMIRPLVYADIDIEALSKLCMSVMLLITS